MKKLTTFSKGRILKISFLMLFACSLFSAQAFASEKNDLDLSLELTIFDADCGNANNGAITTIVSGGAPPYTYAWSNGETTAGIVDLAPGTYTLTVTDAANNTITSSGTVGQESSDIVLDLNASYETCEGSCDGNVSVNASGGTGALTYLWNTGETFVVENDACAGLYSVTVTDENGCTAEGSIELELSPEGIWFNPYGTDATCGSSNDGTARVVIMTGVAPYVVEWSDGQTGEEVTGLSPGTYSITVTDSNGCFNVEEVEIGAGPGNIVLDMNASYETCEGSCDGNASVNASGGTGNYTYLWDDGSTFVVKSDACAGTHTVTVTDDAGCSAVGTVELELSPEGVWIMTSHTDVTCNGANDGTAYASVMSGEAPYEIVWSTTPPQTGPNAVGLSGGTYSVTATDANGCFNVETVTINEPSAIDIIVNFKQDASSCNANDGLINLGVLGGNSPYTYEWNTGATTQDLENLSPGIYTVTVTDADGCTAVSEPIEIEGASSIVIDVVGVVDATCGLANGSIDVTVSGGTTPYTYAWSNSATSEDISGLSAGTYTLTVTDADGCTAVSGPITVNETSAIVITVDNVQDTDCGSANGAIDISVSGGTSPFTYEWSNSAATQDLENLPIGTYTVTVTDVDGCTAVSGPITVDGPSPIVINVIAVTDATCGLANGTIDVNVTGGLSPYTYAWSNSATSEDLVGLSAGTYTLTVTDDAGCTAVSCPITVNETPSVTVALDNVINAECGLNNGAINISVGGGTPPYIFNWDNAAAATSEDIDNLAPGSYSVTVTDAVGCTAALGPITVEEENCCDELPVIQSVVVVEATCGNADGIASIQMVGENADYSYTWNPDVGMSTSPGNSRTNLPAGTYTVTIASLIDPTCPSLIEEFTIGNSNFPEVTVVASTPATCGSSNGSVEMSEPGFEYLWCNGATGYNPTNLPAGICVVEITDPSTNCTDFQTVIIEELPLLDVQAIVNNNPDCGVANGAVTISVNGGSSNYSFEWNPTTNTTATATDLTSGLYSVTVTDIDNSGCEEVVNFVLVDNVPGATITITDPGQVSCVGLTDATVLYDILYDTAFAQPPVVEIIDVNGNVQTNGSLSVGTYFVMVADANDCLAGQAEFEVTQPDQIDMDLAIHNTCDPSPGIEVVEVLGGTPAYTFDWSDLPGTNNPEDRPDLETGTYGLTVTDANGCTASVDNLMVIDTCSCPPMIISSVVVVESECGEATGQATVNVVGAATSNYAYEWAAPLNGNTQPSVIGLAAGVYTVTITNLDQPNCNIVEEFSVGNSDGPDAAYESTASLCGSENGTVTFSNPDYEYTWTYGPGFESENVPAGTYFVTITDPNEPDCIDIQTIVVDEAPSFGLSYTVNTLPDCGSANGVVTVMPDVVGDYSYSWGDMATVDNLSSGAYQVTVTDNANGCTASINFVLTDNVPNVNLNLDAEVLVSCPGENDGEVEYMVDAGFEVEIQDMDGVLQTNGELAPGTYCLVVKNADGCVAGGECVDVKDPAQIDVDIAVFDEICGEPGSIELVEVLGGQAPYTYAWSNADMDSIANDLQSGFYTFTLTDSRNCQVSETVLVEDDPNALSLLISGDTTICGAPTMLTAEVLAETYEWTNPLGEVVGETPTIMADMTGMYYVMVANGDCVDMDSIMITPGELNVQIADVVACFGTSEMLNPMGVDSLVYEWTPTDILDDPTAPNPMVTTNASTMLTVTISDSLGACEQVIDVNYEVIDEVDLSLTSDGPIFCSDDHVNLTAISNANVSWYDNPTLELPIATGLILENVSPGGFGNSVMYYAVANQSGCIAVDSIMISNAGLSVEIIGDGSACAGDTVFLSPEFPAGVEVLDFTYIWTGPGIVDPSADEIQVVASNSATYTLEVLANDCSAMNDMDLSVSDFSDAQATATPEEVFLSDPSQLNVTGDDNWTYEWMEDDSFLDPTDIADPEVQPEETTDYVVTITDENGCVDIRTVTVTVTLPDCDEPFIFFPNAFSPNGDGFNDELLLRGQDVTEVFFAIYDRWGEKVFESNSQAEGWDGTFRGKELSPDVYGFYLRVRCGNGDEFYKQGNVTLFR